MTACMKRSLLAAAAVVCATAQLANAAPRYVEGQILVRFKEQTSFARAKMILDANTFEVARPLIPSMGLYLIKTKNGVSTLNGLRALAGNAMIRYAQPDHIVTRRESVPNDREFAKQWSMSNPSKIDISATRAWDLGRGGKDKGGRDLVVAIVDGGVDVTHPDLRENIWVNRAEVPGNNVDDDGNGYVDDVYGWNAFNHSGKIPADFHGTHVAGIAGAKGNNGNGVAGVNWDVKLMAVAASSGTTSIIAEGYGYVLAQKKLYLESRGTRGANVVSTNSSFGVDYADCKTGEYPVWNDIYQAMGQVGILSAAATANLNIDVDVRGDVPTGCASDFIVAVTNTTNQDNRNGGAAYGPRSVDLGAPGTAIYATVPGGSYSSLTGTSMATPHVAGAVAYMHSVASPEFFRLYATNPAQGALVLKAIMLQSVDQIPALKGITVSHGRLNLFKAGQAIATYKGRR